jgi:pimeloyl-ACP methyl ester carboxylesterase
MKVMVTRDGVFGVLMHAWIALVTLPFVGAKLHAQLNDSPDRQLTPCTVSDGGGPEALCGVYTVYEDRRAGRGRTIDLNILILKAPEPVAGKEPLVAFFGGPGQGAATDGARDQLRRQAQLWPDRDVILVDQRGTGVSNGLQCEFQSDESDEALRAAFGVVFGAERFRECMASLSARADLTLYTTDLAMEDMDEIRGWLGHERLVLTGGSYGTRAAQVYMRMYPGRVAAAILDGVVPMDARSPLMYGHDAQRALDRLITIYEQSVEGRAPGAPKLRSEFASILRLARRDPVTTSVVNPFTGEPFQVRYNAGDLAYTVRTMLYSPTVFVNLPWMVHEAFMGNWESLAQRYLDRGLALGGFSDGMYFSVFCSEDVPFIRDDDVGPATRDTYLGTHLIDDYREICDFWPKRPVDPSFHEPVATDVPILAFSGSLDPSTPPEGATRALSRMPNSVHLTVRGAGHGSLGLPGAASCVAGLRKAFMEHFEPFRLDVSCVAELGPIPMVTSRPPAR